MYTVFPGSHRLCWVVAAGWLLAAPAVMAKDLNVMPKTNHPALTQTTDETFGYQVFPGKPLKLDLVGPGALTVTVRLNHKRKRPVFKGQMNIRRGRKLIKRARLRLHRSRVGGYQEDAAIHPSVPKVFRIRVPDGLQSYTFGLRAARGVSMTVQLAYDSEADQSAAKSEDADALALVPLVPGGGPADSDAGGPAEKPPEDGGLVPLAPIAPEKPPEKKQPGKVAATTKPPEEKKPPAAKPPAPPVTREKPPEVAAKTKPVFEKIAPSKKPEKKSTASVRTIDIPAAGEPKEVKKTAPAAAAHVISLGLKAGQISPLITRSGGTTFMGSLDLRYILPVFDERLTLGVEAGYYNYKLVWTNHEDRTFDTKVIPVSLQLFYRVPLATLFQLFFGAGGDVFVCMSEDSATEESETTFAFGGHVSLGAEAELGPGFLLLEVRAGASFGDAGALGHSDISGLATMLGYRFVF